MNTTKGMLEVHPALGETDADALAECIKECYNCAQICVACADACLGEKNIDHLVQCIRTTLDCAEVCEATGRLLSRLTDFDWTLVRSQMEACLMTCQICADECEKNSNNYRYCRLAYESCNQCEEVCNRWLQAHSLAMQF